MALASFIWAVRKGQYDDLESPPYRMLLQTTNIKKQKKIKKD